MTKMQGGEARQNMQLKSRPDHKARVGKTLQSGIPSIKCKWGVFTELRPVKANGGHQLTNKTGGQIKTKRGNYRKGKATNPNLECKIRNPELRQPRISSFLTSNQARGDQLSTQKRSDR